MNIRLSRFHFWITYLGVDILLGTKALEFMSIRPRRYVEYEGWASFNLGMYLDKLVLTIPILIVIAQFLFLFNITYSLLIKKKGKFT